MTSLGSLFLEIGLKADDIDRQMQRLQSQVLASARTIESQAALKMRVDDRALTDLNKHLNLKQQHYKQVQADFNKPLTPKVDTRQLDVLEQRLDRLNAKKTSVNVGVTGDAQKSGVDRMGEEIGDRVGKSVAKAVGRSSGGIFGGLSGVFKALNPANLIGGVIGDVGRGLFEGVGRDLSRDLSAGIAQGVNIKAAPMIGSFQLLGRELASGLTEDFIKALGSDAAAIQGAIEGIVGKDKILIESGVSAAKQKRETAQKTNEASRYYAGERSATDFQGLRTERESIGTQLTDLSGVRGAVTAKVEKVADKMGVNKLKAQAEQVAAQIKDGDGDPTQLIERLKALRESIDTVNRSAEAMFKDEIDKIKRIEERLNDRIRAFEQKMVPFEAEAVLGEVVAPAAIPQQINASKQRIGQYQQRQGQLQQSSAQGKVDIAKVQSAIQEEQGMPEGWRDDAKLQNAQKVVEVLKKEQLQRGMLYKKYAQQIEAEQQRLTSLQAQASLPQAIAAEKAGISQALEEYTQKRDEWSKEASIAIRAGDEGRAKQLLAAKRGVERQIEQMQEQLAGLAWEDTPLPQQAAMPQAQKTLSQAQNSQPNNPQVFNEIFQRVADRSGVDLAGKQTPRLVLDQTLSEGTGAEYSFKDNHVKVPKDLHDRLQQSALTAQDYTDLVHESRHAVQYDMGNASSKQAAQSPFLLTPNQDEYKQFSHNIEGSVEHQPDGAKRTARKLEKDAYTFAARETGGIQTDVERGLAQDNFESQFGAGGGKARLQVSQAKKGLLAKLEASIASSTVDVSEELEKLIKGLEHMQQSIEPILEQAANVDLPAAELNQLAAKLPAELRQVEKAMLEMAIGFKQDIQAKPANVQEQLSGSLSQFNRKKVLVPLAEQFGVEDAGKLNKKDLIQQLTAPENLRELQPQVNAMTRQRALQQMARRERVEDFAEGAGNLARNVGAGVQKAGAVAIDLANSPQAKAALNAIGGAAQPMLAVAKTGYALASAMEAVALDMVPMGRTVKKLVQTAAVPAIGAAGVAMLPGGTAVMGSAMHMIGAAGGTLGHGLGASAGGELGSAIAGGLPQAFGIQGAISSSISGLLTAGGTAAGEIGAQAAAILGAGRLLQRTLSAALPQLPEMPSLPPGTDRPQLPQAKPVQDAIAVVATEAPRQLKAAIVNTEIPTTSANPPPLALPPAAIQDGRGAIAAQLKEQYSVAGLREIAKRAGMTAKTSNSMKKEDLAEHLASSPSGVPIDQILAEVGDSAKLKKFQATGQSSVPKVPTEVLTSIRSASAKVQQLYKAFQAAQGQERVNLAQAIAHQADQQVAAIDEALKAYQIKGSDAQSLAGLRTQLEQRSSLPRNEARAAAVAPVRQTQAQAQRTGASVNYQTIDVDVQALKSIKDIQEGAIALIERLRNAAKGIGQQQPSPEVAARLHQLTAEIDQQTAEHVTKQLQRLERELESEGTRSAVGVTPSVVKPPPPPPGAPAVQTALRVQEIAAAKAQAANEENLPVQSIAKAAKFDAAAARIENKADQQASKTQAAIGASSGEGDSFTKIKSQLGERVNEYAQAFKKGVGVVGDALPQALEAGAGKIPGSGIWTGTFSAQATKNLLETPLNLGSKLVKAVRDAIDPETGYGTAKLEIQIGSPYFVTWHSTVTIGKGLIA